MLFHQPFEICPSFFLFPVELNSSQNAELKTFLSTIKQSIIKTIRGSYSTLTKLSNHELN